jgi:hypothetical protein
MSFADPNLPRSGAQRTESPRNPAPASTDIQRRVPPDHEDVPTVERPRGSSFRRAVDWEHVGLLGAGPFVGALVGAGAALLLAPQSGVATRGATRRQARFARHRATDAWSELADELAAAARRGRRRARRALRRARWRASDAIA